MHTYGEDRVGRTRGDIFLTDGRNLSEILLKAGMAWWSYKDSDDEQLGVLEVKAKIAKVGLWTIPNPIPPWIFRHPGKLAYPSSQTPLKRLP